MQHLKAWRGVSLRRTDFFQRALPWTNPILSALLILGAAPMLARLGQAAPTR